MIDLALFLQLSASCAPHVAAETLAAVARTESGFNELAIYDDSERRDYAPASVSEAVALATGAIEGRHHSVDLGLMQVNSANLQRLGLSIGDAFDPCRNIAAAQQILMEGYVEPAVEAGRQAAVYRALSRYNTGDPARGVTNGYVARVQASAEQVVPAIRLQHDTLGPPAARSSSTPATARPAPPSWDVYRQAGVSRGAGTLVFGGGTPNVPAPAAIKPIQSRTASTE